ncbi:MAG TPA: histidine kinase dimerization/phospho-acceptor domain-containing protein [Polyangiaceae bacterium]|nr:histidine kinase dimerization/phospho-acceptor domain-containing protein [Polyangiaceae bacterium]
MTAEDETKSVEAMRAELSELRRAAALRAGETRVLQLVAEEAPLVEVLTALAREFEAHAEGMLASILLVEGGRVRHGAAPSLPEAWSRTVDGEPVGPDRGSCGTAADSKEAVIVSDIERDPRWVHYRDAALGFGLRACWSIPIMNHAREVLGTFAFYYTSPREPTAELLALATRASHVATIALERQRQRTERRRLEREVYELRRREQLHAALDLTPSAVAITRDGIVRYANRRFVDQFGFTVGENVRARLLDERVGAKILDDVRQGIANAGMELQARAKSGEVLDLLVAYSPIEYEHLPSVLLYLVDVSRFKEAQHAVEAANQAKSRFFANMSHEIRTPLNAVLGYAQLVARDRNLSEDQRRSIDVIQSSGQKLLTLMNELLAMANVDAKRAHPPDQVFDLVSFSQGKRSEPPGPPPEARAARLSELVTSLPAPLVEELRAAAVEARAGRIAALADEVRPHSEAAALEIQALIQGFRYEELLGALEGRSR